MTSLARMEAAEVRATRLSMGLSASQAAEIVGLSEGAAWRRWERDGVTGAGAILLRALTDSAAARRYFGVNLVADSTRKSG